MLVLEAGISKNGYVHGPEKIKEALASGIFGATAQAYADHNDESLTGKLIGHFKNLRYNDNIKLASGRVTEGLVGELEMYETEIVTKTIRPLLEAQKKYPDRKFIGPSIDALSELRSATYDGKNVRIVESYKKLSSIDIVINPSAGDIGIIREAFEPIADTPPADPPATPPASPPAEKTYTEEEFLARIKEAEESALKKTRIRENVRNILGENADEYANIVCEGDPVSIANALNNAILLEQEKARKEQAEPVQESRDSGFAQTEFGLVDHELASIMDMDTGGGK